MENMIQDNDKLGFTVQGPYSEKELSEILQKIGFPNMIPSKNKDIEGNNNHDS